MALAAFQAIIAVAAVGGEEVMRARRHMRDVDYDLHASHAINTGYRYHDIASTKRSRLLLEYLFT